MLLPPDIYAFKRRKFSYRPAIAVSLPYCSIFLFPFGIKTKREM